MSRFCYRCEEELAPAGGAAPTFCPHCGAPQLELHVADDRAVSLHAVADGDTTGEPPPPPTGLHAGQAIDWRTVLQGSAAVAAIAAVLCLLSFPLPAISILCWLWILSGSLIVLETYRRRRPAARIDARVGARIGLVFGLALDGSLALAVAVAGLLARFVTRGMGPIDAQLTAVLQAQTTQAAATVPNPADVIHFFSTPEFRTGLVLAVLTFAGAILLLLTTLSGALAGVLGPRRSTTP